MTKHPDTAPRVDLFAEEDYRFGSGPLLMVVEQIDWTNPSAHDGERWYDVQGMELRSDGRTVGRRRVSIRGSRLHRTRKLPGQNA